MDANVISLTKVSAGERFSLTKVDGTPLTNFSVGAGWDLNRFHESSGDYDIDLVSFLCDEKGICLGVDYFIAGGGPRAFRKPDGSFFDHDPEGAVHHTGDNTTGEGDGDDERIDFDLTKLNPKVARIPIIAVIYDVDNRGLKFSDIDNAFFRIVDANSGDTTTFFDLTENNQYSDQTALVGFELYRKNGEWKCQAVGKGYNKDILALCTEYGLNAAY